ncbi:MAG: response regulator [Oscillospiraceae bacterium]|jgi:CheY-like chemotaxis protein/HPt (histidine-containing phosphotransfer) domain-containing protein|nr:response regulator [Oscillospiraceae bacterium]
MNYELSVNAALRGEPVVNTGRQTLFLANVSHEIRTPVSAITGMAKLFREDNLDKTQVEYLKNIRSMSDTLLAIINDILDFSRIDTGRLNFDAADYSFTRFWDDVTSLFEFLAASKSLEFRKERGPDLPAVIFGDALRTRQILVNLLTNAVKYTREGYVLLKAELLRTEGGEYLVYTVSDTGVGIKDADYEPIFDTFFRADEISANRNIEGTGLGLAITKSLVALMAGEICFESKYGVGSTFRVYLPLVRGDPDNIIAAVEGSEIHASSDVDILVVDDSKINLTVTLGYLKSYGFSADSALNGREAFEMARSKRYDLIFLDHMMPEMNGLETAAALRAMPGEYFKKLPIIALSANAVLGAKEFFEEAGMNDFLEKPIKESDLAAILTKYLPAGSVEITYHNDVPEPDLKALATGSHIVDRARGIRNFGNDPLLYEKVLRDFTKDHLADYSKLMAAVNDNRTEDATRIAHTIKSTAALIGAETLRAAAYDCEMSLRHEKSCPEGLTDIFKARFDAVISELGDNRTADDADGESENDADKVLDNAKTVVLLSQLIPLLQRGALEVFEYSERIKETLSPFGDLYHILAEHIDEFAFGSAATVAEQMLDSLYTT